MKYLVFTLALLIAMPTVQAGWCAVGEFQETTETSNNEGHDCCPGGNMQEPVQEPLCDDESHCSGCLISMSAVPVSLTFYQHMRPEMTFLMPLPHMPPSHSLPPYRPPIS